jgi:hypothetical protein
MNHVAVSSRTNHPPTGHIVPPPPHHHHPCPSSPLPPLIIIMSSAHQMTRHGYALKPPQPSHSDQTKALHAYAFHDDAMGGLVCDTPQPSPSHFPSPRTVSTARHQSIAAVSSCRARQSTPVFTSTCARFPRDGELCDPHILFHIILKRF